MRSTLRLFKALPLESKVELDKDRAAELMEKTIPLGFVFEPVFSSRSFDAILGKVNALYGRNPEELNSSFHKSFAKVRDSSIRQLAFEQMIHYLTTYGAERLGIYDEDSVYIPAEALEAPELKEGVRLVVIHGYTKDELKEKLLNLLSSGVALSNESVTDAVEVSQYVGISSNEVNQIVNKEVRAALYDHLDIVPQNPVEFLRFIVYKSTQTTLLIKNKELIEDLKSRDNNMLVRYFNSYEKMYGLEKLAQIFYRFKPIFLALRTNSGLKRHVNKIRRLAKAYHKPTPEDLLNSITYRLKTHQAPDADPFKEAMANTNIFRKIRLAYALKFRTTEADSVMYRVRNGKSFTKEFEFENKRGAQILYEAVLRYIANDIKPNVEGKTFFIPKEVKYAIPSTEKMFTGEIPSGSYVELDNDMVVGVHWFNTSSQRVDLDLSLSNGLGKIGWDGQYSTGKRNILFSGDITDAPKPKGASELFWVSSESRGSWLVNLNFYNYRLKSICPFKIFVGQSDKSLVDRKYVVDSNSLVVLTNSVMDKKHKALGIINVTDKHSRFYFMQSGLEQAISSQHTESAERARKFALNYYTDIITLNEVLELAGAKVVGEMAEGVVDLSPEAADKTAFIDLLSKKSEEKSNASDS